MVTEDDVRRVALSLPATVEKSYNRLPSFRVGSNLFIRIHELPDVLFVRCANPEERDELLKAEPEKFFITPHYDGYPAVLVRLAQGSAQEAASVPAGTLRIPPEQLRLGVGSQRGESKQVSDFDPRQRPIRIPGHAAILSRRVPIHPMPQRAVCGMSGCAVWQGWRIRAVPWSGARCG